MKVISRTPLGECTLLRGNFGAPLVANFRGYCVAHLRSVERLKEEVLKRYPERAANFDAYVSRIRAFAAGRADITHMQLKRELDELRKID